jgi:hypothetical protein
MSQSDLAQAVGKSPAYTNQTMTGRKHASPEWVNLVAETLNLSSKERVVLHRAAGARPRCALHPFGAHKDRIDATSRVYDLDPHAPAMLEGRATTEPIELDDDEIMEDALSG